MWPSPRYPNLNPRDFFRMESSKTVYENNLHKSDELKENIRREIIYISHEVLHQVSMNTFQRCEACLVAEGCHFEYGM